jgi:hypothetical protein
MLTTTNVFPILCEGVKETAMEIGGWATTFHERIRQGVIDAHARPSGHWISDLDSDGRGERKAISSLWALLFEDRVFEDALLNPVVYTMARYMCGKSVILSDLVGLIKNQDDRPSHTLHV